VAFTWPNLCSLDLASLFIVLVGRYFVSVWAGLAFVNLNLKNLKTKTKTFLLKSLGFSNPEPAYVIPNQIPNPGSLVQSVYNLLKT